ncbi:MAG: hypothetical protein U9P68_12980 [Pseudomonadota bacterium]|nr:hypothetical protein [Pseudomonadota bacterium]
MTDIAVLRDLWIALAGVGVLVVFPIILVPARPLSAACVVLTALALTARI